MYQGKKILALIPARGGSKGIKDKNIYLLNEKPLISYTISAALGCTYIDDVIVTTDSPVIASVSQEYGAKVPFLRPAEMAGDKSKTIDAVLHSVLWLDNNGSQYDILVLLQPTSPLRESIDIKNAIEIFFDNGLLPLASVCEVEDHPVLIRTVQEGRMNKLLDQNSTVRRQDMDKYYRINGAIYINLVKELDRNTSFNDNIIPYIMPRERAVDIDTETDILLAGILMEKDR